MCVYTVYRKLRDKIIFFFFFFLATFKIRGKKRRLFFWFNVASSGGVLGSAAGRMSARTESAPSPSNGCIQWHLNGSRGCKQQKIFDFIRLCTFAHSDRNETCLTRGKFNEGKGNQLRETKGKWMKEEGKRNRPRSLEKKRRNNWSRPLPLRDSHATDAVDNTETLLPRLNNKSLSFRLSPCALSCCSFPFFFFFSWRATSLYWEGRAITKSPLPLNGNQLDKSSRCCCCCVFLGFFSFLVQ